MRSIDSEGRSGSGSGCVILGKISVSHEVMIIRTQVCAPLISEKIQESCKIRLLCFFVSVRRNNECMDIFRLQFVPRRGLGICCCFLSPASKIPIVCSDF